MKKKFDRKILCWILGFISLAIELIVVRLNLTSLNVLTYLSAIGFFPAIILFVTSLIYSSQSRASKLGKYIASIVCAIVFSVVLLVYCDVFISKEIVDQIIQNSISSDTTQVSMNTATAGDNIQSILLYVAFSGLGCYIGTLVYKKKNKSVVDEETKLSEYD